jgi:mRNA-degrading endonuclease RelE of RelBE toxin-antitoxin system
VTKVGAGGVVITSWSTRARFDKDYDKLTPQLKNKVDQKLEDLTKNPMPAGLRFEKLSGRHNPSIFTVHITGNYKMSMEIESSEAILRRVGTHNDIDRAP